jgi:MoaA/NifB/PqqE/SkfB family radical SAM enzyme
MSIHSTGAPYVSSQDLSFLWLEITGKCNLECVHCYADSGPQRNLLGNMRTEQWLDIMRDAAAAGCRQLQFIGGEPTLHPGLPRMIAFASDQGYEFVEVFTNATRLHDRLLQTFVEHGIHVAVSFYSDDAATHDAITQRTGSFTHTVENLRRIVSSGVSVRAGIIETARNSGHAQRAARFLLEEVGVREIRVDLQRGVGRAANSPAPDESMQELCGECWKGKLCITSAGVAHPCVFSRFAHVGIAEDGICSILTSAALLDFREKLRQYRSERDERPSPTSAEGVTKNLALGAECRPTCTPAGCSPCGPDEFRDCAPGRAVQRSRCSPCQPWSFECGPNVFPKPPAPSPPQPSPGPPPSPPRGPY